jgi:transposase-like protein
MMANILDKLPQTQQQQARADLHRIYYAATKAEAISRVVYFSERYRAHPSAVRCLLEDQNDLLTFFDFPKAHWRQRRLPESGVLTESRSSPRDHSDTAQFLLHNI